MSIQITCPKCGVFNDIKETNCWKCKRLITEDEKKSAIVKDTIKKKQKQAIENLSQDQKDELYIKKAKINGDWSVVPEDTLNRAASRIILTTSFQVATHAITSEISIVTAEVAYGMNFFRDLFASVTDIVGGRSDSIQKVLRDARKTVLLELKKEALMVDADAVISVDLDYQEFSGGGKNGMIMLIASGTAVTIEKDLENT